MTRPVIREIHGDRSANNYSTVERSVILPLTCPTSVGYCDASLRPGVQPVNCVCWVTIAVSYEPRYPVLQRLAAMNLDPRRLPPDGASGFIGAIKNRWEKALSAASADNAHQRPGFRGRCGGRSATLRATPGRPSLVFAGARNAVHIAHNLARSRSFWQMPIQMKLGAISQQGISMCEGV